MHYVVELFCTTFDEIVQKPVHPDEDLRVQAARREWLAADKTAVEALQRPEKNHQVQCASGDETERALAQAQGPALLVRMLESKVSAREAQIRYDGADRELLEAASSTSGRSIMQ